MDARGRLAKHSRSVRVAQGDSLVETPASFVLSNLPCTSITQ